MNEVWQTIGHWIQVHKWIQWVFSGVGLLAFSFLARLWKLRTSDEKPQILFERSGRPHSGHPHPLVRGKRIDALYKFKIKNAGHQAAVLGDNPFRAIDYIEVYRRTLKKKRMARIMVAIPEGHVVPNVLEPGMSFNLDIALGHFGKKAMSDRKRP